MTGVVADSRGDLTGKLFAALKGERADGADFIPRAFANGAAACLSPKAPEGFPAVIAPDTPGALLALASWYRRRFGIPVVGVTGSAGKTTTKDMIASVLSERFNTVKTAGNRNSRIGTPLTLFDIGEDTEAAVVEMGMSTFGEMRDLSEAVRPTAAVITNIGLSHAEYLGGRDGVLAAKSEIFEGMDPDAPVFMCGDDDLLAGLRGKRKNIYYYGTGFDNDFRAADIEYLGTEGSIVVTNTGARFRVPLPGRHMAVNAVCAAAVGQWFGLSADEIACGIENLTPTAMRMSVIKTPGGAAVINDAYNASPDSMKAALDALAALGYAPRIAVLGDMLELGGGAARLHAEAGAYARAAGVDALITVGELAANYGGVRAADNRAAAEAAALAMRPGCAVLVKASRGMRFEEIVDIIKEF